MTLYCGIDLHSNNSFLSVIDESDRVLYEKRLPNDLATIQQALQPYEGTIAGVVVESTYNWYWLVDGLRATGFDVRLANTVALKQYDGLKYTDDKSDARHLAHMLRLGILPEGYVMPFEARCVRDLLRRRLLLVRQRVMQQLSLQSLIARHTGQRLTGPQIQKLDAQAINTLLPDPAAQLAARTARQLMVSLRDAVDHLEQYVAGHCQSTPAYALLTSVPGIGPMIGQSILLENGPIERFPSVNDYVSYARCVPSHEKKLGSVTNENHLSPTPNCPNCLLYFDAPSMLNDGLLKMVIVVTCIN